MANKMRLPHSGANAAKMKRLRDVFRAHLGTRTDPFEPYRKGSGGCPDSRLRTSAGPLTRAKREAERRTDSYEQLNDRGDRFADTYEADRSVDCGNDDADEWLKNNDPNEAA